MARQAAQKEATDARKKKKAEVAQRKYKKEKEIARRVKKIRVTSSPSSSQRIPQMWMTWFSPRRRKAGRSL